MKINKILTPAFSPSVPHLITIKPLVPLLCVLMLSGCASMPRYSHVKTDDSAELRAPIAFFNMTRAPVSISSIDGMFAGTPFPLPNLGKPRYAAPGKHLIGLTLESGSHGAHVTFPLMLQPAHRYEFQSFYRSKNLEVVVLDLTTVPSEVVLRALVPIKRKGSIIYLPNKKPETE